MCMHASVGILLFASAVQITCAVFASGSSEMEKYLELFSVCYASLLDHRQVVRGCVHRLVSFRFCLS